MESTNVNLTDFGERADDIIALGETASATSGRTEWGGSHLSSAEFMEFRSAALSFLRNVFGSDHPYYEDFNKETSTAVEASAQSGLGIMVAAKNEVLGGWARTATGIVSAEIFSDFLEMAEHLLGSGYKDAAAVMVGGVLEEHLRQLCRKHSIPVSRASTSKPKTADRLNADLAGAEVYNKLDQKAVTSWLDLRNKAAHGNYDEYTIEQVQLMLEAVRNFLVRIAI